MTGSNPLANLKIGPKLITSFLIIGILPFAILGILALNNSSNALHNASFNQLEAVRAIKKAQIESFFDERQGDMGVLVETVGTLRQEAINKLTAIRDIKKDAIESYFKQINNQVTTLADNGMIVDAMREFSRLAPQFRSNNLIDAARLSTMRTELATYYTGQFSPEYQTQNGTSPDVESWLPQLSDDAVALQYEYIQANQNPLGSKHMLDKGSDSSEYSTYHKKVHPSIRGYLEKFGYYDIFLVEPENGNIVYSVFKELDFGTSLINGPWAKTNFAEAFRKARGMNQPGTVALVDYKLYTPSYDAPAGFIASPIFEGGKLTGVLVFQMPLDRITEVMSQRAGLGDTGETILVGPDYLMRSDSHLDKENRSVVASFRNPAKGKVKIEATIAVFEKSESGIKVIKDYRKQMTIISHTPVDIGGVTWALNAKVDVAEALVPVDLEGKEFFAEYIAKYGYYDLFLMNPDGYVFYTATREADYQTNMVDGKYKDSGLGILTRKVLSSGKYGVADFAPYAPSNDDPAGFIAQPVLNNGKTEMVVGLQLSLEAINHIMQQREGMGESGESYLIGEDALMRSDSFLDPVNHTVKASFANPEKGSVNSVSAKKAMEGKSGSEIVIDYNGNPVLSSYTSIKVGDTNWSLLTEIDEAEAFAPVNELQLLMLIIAGVGTVVIFIIGLLMARSIGRPIQGMTAAMGGLAGRDMTVVIPSQDRGDEIGEMAAAVQVFKDNMIRADELAEQQQADVKARQASSDRREELTGKFGEDVASVLKSVGGAVHQMENTSNSMSSTAEQTSNQANTVAAAAEQASASVQTVSAAAEELASSVSEIGRQVEQSSKISAQAVSDAAATNQKIQGLATAVDRIGEVVALITDIADQTNLLALNATIEAARAGDAGKGFAVVASEVKNLANQTAKATEEISEQITNVQAATQDAVVAIEGVGGIIRQVDEIASAIASAVEEQGAATKEIAQNVEQAANGAQEVTSNIVGVSQAATDTGQAAQEVLLATTELNRESEQLRKNVETFLVEVQQA